MNPSTKFRTRRGRRYLIVLALLVVSTGIWATSLAARTTGPEAAPQASEVAVSGVVTSVLLGVYTIDYGGSFTLDYGSGTVRVEMEDWNSPGETPVALIGERVTVHGNFENGWFQERALIARAIHFDRWNATYWAHLVDNEGVFSDPERTPRLTRYGNWTGIEGDVTGVSGNGFVMVSDGRTLRIDAANLRSNVVDERGLRQVEVGDRVTVYGERDPSAGDDIAATSIIVRQEESGL